MHPLDRFPPVVDVHAVQIAECKPSSLTYCADTSGIKQQLLLHVILVLLQGVVVCLGGVQDDIGIRVEVPRRIVFASGSRKV